MFHAIPTVLDQQSARTHSSVIFGKFWTFLGHFGRPWAKIWDTSRKDTPPIVSKRQPGCPVTRSTPFQLFGTTRVLKVIFWSFLAIFGQFWPFLGAWAKIWDTPRKDTLPTVSKPQPGCPVTRSMPLQLFGTTRVLKVIFWPFFDHFGPFWPLRGQKFGTHPTQTHSQLCQNLSQDVL